MSNTENSEQEAGALSCLIAELDFTGYCAFLAVEMKNE